MANKKTSYPAHFDVDYPPKLDRLSTFFRVILAIPILVVLQLLYATSTSNYMSENSEQVSVSTGGILMGLFFATVLMILFRQRYPRWWFDFNLELNRFAARVSAYLLFLTDKYPSTVDAQSVHLDVPYPDVKNDLNRGLPLVKWFLAIPHYVVLVILSIGLLLTSIIAWFAILFTGRYPRSLFDFAVGVGRYNLRVSAYSVLLTTDVYPPFSLKK